MKRRVGKIRITRKDMIEHEGALGDLFRSIGFKEEESYKNNDDMTIHLIGTSKLFDEVDDSRVSTIPYYAFSGHTSVERIS